MWTERVAPTAPKKIIRAFDEANYYVSGQQPLTGWMPDSFVTRQFRDYIDRNHERVSQVLTKPYVPKGGAETDPPGPRAQVGDGLPEIIVIEETNS
jgi:hypothetical protein